MWWTIPLLMIVLFIFVGIPLILEYRAETKENYINEQNNTKIIFIKKGEKVMKAGDAICARTHAEFLNEAFGTNYKAWMKSRWNYSKQLKVWMIILDGKVRRGWKNTTNKDLVFEEFVGSDNELLPEDYVLEENYRLIVDKSHNYKNRLSIFRIKLY